MFKFENSISHCKINIIFLVNCVQTITDKPVPTRARATLPESHLVIQKKNDGVHFFYTY